VAVGVGHDWATAFALVASPSPAFGLIPFALLFPNTVGVGQPGDEEEAVSTLRGTNLFRAEGIPFRIIPEGGKVLKHPAKSSRNQRGDIFNNNPSWVDFTDDARELCPEPGARPRDPKPFTGI
jgi:hypothetical protein